MNAFSRDVDIFRYEPVLFGDLHFPSQIIAAGDGGVLNEGSFTVSGEDFVSAGVQAGGVVYLQSDDGQVDGGYEIVSVDTAEQLTLSVIRGEGDLPVSPHLNAGNVSYRISTFAPQAREVLIELTGFFGISPGDAVSDYSAEDVLSDQALRQCSTFGVLSIAYAMLADGTTDVGKWDKSLYYRNLFERSRQRCRIYIDAGGDGQADLSRFSSAGKLLRD